jgi:hypothetical protein
LHIITIICCDINLKKKLKKLLFQMKNKLQENKIYSRILFTLLFGLSAPLIFGQLPDPPPGEVPLDDNLCIVFVISIVFAGFYLVKRSKNNIT